MQRAKRVTRTMRIMKMGLTVATTPVWLPLFLTAMAAYCVYVLMILMASMVRPPRFIREWANHLFA